MDTSSSSSPSTSLSSACSASESPPPTTATTMAASTTTTTAMLTPAAAAAAAAAEITGSDNATRRHHREHDEEQLHDDDDHHGRNTKKGRGDAASRRSESASTRMPSIIVSPNSGMGRYSSETSLSEASLPSAASKPQREDDDDDDEAPARPPHGDDADGAAEAAATTTAVAAAAARQERLVWALALEEASRSRPFPPDAQQQQQQQQPTQADADSLYASDMHSLLPEERERILHDVHGVGGRLPSLLPPVLPSVPPGSPMPAPVPVPCCPEDDPTWVSDRRRQLRKELMMSDTNGGTAAYSMALRDDAGYVQSAEHVELPFLRTTEWDAGRAAKRVIAFFDLRLRLFGQAALCRREVSIADLSTEDVRCLESGLFQLLPVRDVAGRAIVVIMPMLSHSYGSSIDNLMRAFYYMMMTAGHDVETQRNGFILVGCNVGPHRRVDQNLAWCVHRVRDAVPVRTVSIHYCYDDLRTMPMMTVCMLFMGGAGRVRFRNHYGPTITEIATKVGAFGLPAEAVLLVTEAGEPKTKQHKLWLKNRRDQEEKYLKLDEEYRRSMIVVPGRLDCLFGRGKTIQGHYGNLRYHVLLEHNHAAYEAAEKFQKMQIAEAVVDIVHGYGGRFLRQEGPGWVEVSKEAARDKVSHAFRTRRSSSVAANIERNSTTRDVDPIGPPHICPAYPISHGPAT